MSNVKHTTDNGEKLTTSCKKLSTALRRFTAFLNCYDSYYNEMLSEIDNDYNCVVRVMNVSNGSESIVMTLTKESDLYVLTINHDFKHTDIKDTDSKDTAELPRKVWCICTQDGVIKDFYDKKESFKYAYDNKLCGDFDDVWIEEKELRDSAHKYYETVGYESLDLYHVRMCLEFDICDDIKDTDIKDTDIKDTDIKDTDIKDTDSKDTDSKDTFNMKCEYFFSLSPKSPCKCKYCIYSKRDFCPADVERYWGICEE